jgi:hypothetical protein
MRLGRWSCLRGGRAGSWVEARFGSTVLSAQVSLHATAVSIDARLSCLCSRCACDDLPQAARAPLLQLERHDLLATLITKGVLQATFSIIPATDHAICKIAAWLSSEITQARECHKHPHEPPVTRLPASPAHVAHNTLAFVLDRTRTLHPVLTTT